ncbi:xanthine dehydrogenase family protein molybdopterin-binding subunit [Paremcibacter congregatus]|uniref:Isoquinoline 1-oxidoreductase n=1 Tax=Paremcibacter congregatus TaxID=2043170 RepID=A0A2G4YM97_9PROT|nr:molybdopterin cofactor-binding domain-containing protein [Paremcibacter congregatus]PHZ83428.1 isoquinoline 1-oxidoreductase [Paremcibacter congregatus]QDE28104.1 xanthine dehydrogenase family protein molybdopterin-binding subunit [Paremcibacter congregatus]
MTKVDMISSRRRFLQMSGAAGAFMIACPQALMAKGLDTILPPMLAGELGMFIRVEADNTVVLGAPIPDMGQGVFTAVPMIIADEFDADWDTVRIEKLKPYVEKDKEGRMAEPAVRQSAGGSHGVRMVWTVMREAGAVARLMMKQAAAQKWKVDVASLTTAKSHVMHAASGRRIAYGDLIDLAISLDVPDVPPLKTPAEFTLIGHETGNYTAPDIVQGKPLYGYDMQVEGMKHAMIARCPYVDGSVTSYDASDALKIKGVREVVEMKRLPEDMSRQKNIAAGVAVVADTFWAAKKGRDALKITWDKGPKSDLSNESIEREFDRLLTENKTDVQYESGNVDQALATAAVRLDASYDNPYWAHMCMEPHSCVADVKGDKALIIAGHQGAAWAINPVAAVTGIDGENIDVRLARMGTGFGRKFTGDFVGEAALLSQRLGYPVKVSWTREDEVEQDFFNPKSRHRMQAGLDENGHPVAMHYTLATTAGGMATHNFPAHYIDNYKADRVRFKGLPTGAWRGPRHNVAGFAVQSFVDEMAHAAGKDPLAFRLSLLEGKGKTAFNDFGADSLDSDRIIGVLKLAAEKAGWGRKLPQGHGMGIANYFTFGGYAAFVVEVKVDKGALEIVRVTGAVDCGIAVNPLGIKAQMEGGALDGFSAALGQEVMIEEGRVVSNNLDSYQMARINQAPKRVDTYIVESAEAPTGLGEIALPAAIPALCNAIFAASGKRIRRFPIADQLKDI